MCHAFNACKLGSHQVYTVSTVLDRTKVETAFEPGEQVRVILRCLSAQETRRKLVKALSRSLRLYWQGTCACTLYTPVCCRAFALPCKPSVGR